MKQITKWAATALVIAGGTANVASSAHAQAVTGDVNLDNITPTALYGSWATASVTDGPSGVTIAGLASYGSAYFAIPALNQQTLNQSDNQVTLVMTINNAVSPPGTPSGSGGQYWVGIPFVLNDNVENGVNAPTYGGYAGEFGYTGAGTAIWNGNTVTETVPLDPGQSAAIAAGGDVVGGFNLEFDPAVFPTGFQSITFNSLTLSSSVPEPSTLALIGSGAAALFSFRRRNK